jgi:hypothetical protein
MHWRFDMRITANTIGNYTPAYISNNKQLTESIDTSDQVNTQDTKINDEEKSFLINLYPENKNEIVDYYCYQRTGKMTGVSIGSLLDRRG